ncbi:MAG: thioredoxin family protein [Planctomycetota bacterium]|jgi:thiol-disulfide isomerase/thioredoxin
MVMTPSQMIPLGTPAPDFDLPDVDGAHVRRADFEGRPLLVMAICNHCPFVKHINEGLVAFGRDYAEKDLAIVAINSNDVANYPDDSPEKMKEYARELGYTFPYLFDETQEVAKAYSAACTPDFFLFDWEHRLVYRGQFDDSRPDSGIPVTGADLRAAADAVLEGRAPSEDQRPSIGCNIKWKAGNEPGYA